jgi:hypothetical protein
MFYGACHGENKLANIIYVGNAGILLEGDLFDKHYKSLRIKLSRDRHVLLFVRNFSVEVKKDFQL